MNSSNKKIRIDKIMTDRGMAPSREKAQAWVMAGVVFVGDQRVAKPSEAFEEGVSIEIMRRRSSLCLSRGKTSRSPRCLSDFGE
jgi:23S rRNA (cytidine1920-2'-O)/16S rRNA (cytidine1409-2'-O)-methyltransferase